MPVWKFPVVLEYRLNPPQRKGEKSCKSALLLPQVATTAFQEKFHFPVSSLPRGFFLLFFQNKSTFFLFPLLYPLFRENAELLLSTSGYEGAILLRSAGEVTENKGFCCSDLRGDRHGWFLSQRVLPVINPSIGRGGGWSSHSGWLSFRALWQAYSKFYSLFVFFFKQKASPD